MPPPPKKKPRRGNRFAKKIGNVVFAMLNFNGQHDMKKGGGCCYLLNLYTILHLNIPGWFTMEELTSGQKHQKFPLSKKQAAIQC